MCLKSHCAWCRRRQRTGRGIWKLYCYLLSGIDRQTRVNENAVHFRRAISWHTNNWNALFTKQPCLYLRATRHAPQRWTAFLPCRGLRLCMNRMSQRVGGVRCFDRNTRASSGWWMWFVNVLVKKIAGEFMYRDSSGKTSLVLPAHLSLLCWENNECCVREALPGLVEDYHIKV